MLLPAKLMIYDGIPTSTITRTFSSTGTRYSQRLPALTEALLELFGFSNTRCAMPHTMAQHHTHFFVLIFLMKNFPSFFFLCSHYHREGFRY